MNMLRRRESQVITAYGLSQPFKYGRGVPQGGVESPLIWNLAYDISLARLKKENSPFKSVVFAPSVAPKMQELINNATEIESQLTSFVNDLALFFNSREDMERALTRPQEFNKIAGIRANQTKSVYCLINCPNPLAVIVNNIAISPANQRTKQRLLGSFFSPALGIRNSLHHASTVLKKSLSILKSNLIGPQRLRYFIQSVICPALAYQFSIAPCSLPLLKRLSSAVFSAVEKHLHLSKDFPTSFIFSDCAFGSEEMESLFLAKSLGVFYIAFQKGSRNNEIANAFLAQLNFKCVTKTLLWIT
jgi:Reverse transcriptase (RNA-dependent DNA polymerase)